LGNQAPGLKRKAVGNGAGKSRAEKAPVSLKKKKQKKSLPLT